MADMPRHEHRLTRIWRVRDPKGQEWGPYTQEELAHWVEERRIGLDWQAQRGSGEQMMVREALPTLREPPISPDVESQPAVAPYRRRAEPADTSSVLIAYFPGATAEQVWSLIVTLIALPAIGILGALLSEHVWAAFWLAVFGGLPWGVGLLLSALYYITGTEGVRKLGRIGLIVAWLIFAIAELIVVRRIDVGIGALGSLAPISAPSLGIEKDRAHDVECQFNNYWTARQIGSGFMVQTADSGKVYMIVNITARNKGKEEILIDQGDFELVCSDKNVYNPVYSMGWSADSRISRFSAKLLPGGAATGDTVFEVAQGAKPVEIRYSPSFF